MKLTLDISNVMMKSKKKGLKWLLWQFFEKSCWRGQQDFQGHSFFNVFNGGFKEYMGNASLDNTENLKLILDFRTYG